MFRKALLFSAMGCMLAIGLQAAEVFVRIAPPRAIVERPVPRPGPEYVYTPGYHRWDGHAHVWVPGVWVVPPRRHAHWVAHHWEHRRGGYVFVEGHWR